MSRLGDPVRWGMALALALVLASAMVRAASGPEPTLEQLKARVSSARVSDKVRLCLQIAQRQLVATDKAYAAAEDEPGKAALTDVVAFSELARDYAIQSHHHEKETEIAVRGMARKLTDLMRTLPHDEQPPLRDALSHLQRVRDDLLIAMFPKGAK
jgi:hypothetical protein